MHPINSLVNGTLEDAAEALSKVAAYRRVVPLSFAEKQALSVGDTLTGLGTHIKQNPILASTLLGGGLGAAAGGLGTAWSNKDKPEHERKSLWQSMLTGGMAGAALGGGAGAAYKGLSNIGKPGELPAEGPTVDINGRKLQLTPEALKQNPNLLQEVNDAQAPRAGDLLNEGFGAAATTGWNLIPSSWKFMAPLDAALHSKALRTGERFGVGYMRPEHSVDPRHLRLGLEQAESKLPGLSTDAVNALQKDEASLKYLGKNSLPEGSTKNYGTKVPVMEKLIEKTGPQGHQVTRETMQHASDPATGARLYTNPSLNAQQLRQAKHLGATIAHDMPQGSDPGLFRIGSHVHAANSPTTMGRLGRFAGRRILPYGLAAIAERALMNPDQARDNRLEDIVRRLQEQGVVKEAP